MPEDLKQCEEDPPSANQEGLVDEQLEIALIRAKRAFNKHKKTFGKRAVKEAFDDLEEAADDGLIAASKNNELSADEHKVKIFIENWLCCCFKINCLKINITVTRMSEEDCFAFFNIVKYVFNI